jgi:hypothetical protein
MREVDGFFPGMFIRSGTIPGGGYGTKGGFSLK